MGDREALQLVVVEEGTSLACSFAGRLLADGGARVVRLEPDGGSELARRPPLLADGSSAWFRYLCRGVEVLPAGSPLDLTPDIVLIDGDAAPPGGGAAPPPRAPSTIEVAVSCYGPGPYEGWRPSELAVWALGGYLSFTGAPDREPLWLSGGQAALHAGSQAAFAALAAVHGRDRSGAAGGQRVEVSELASVLSAHAWLVSSWAACGQVLPRMPQDLIRASDGWCYVMRIVPSDNLFVLIDRPDLAAEGLTSDLLLWFANVERIFAAVAAWAADKTVAEIVELGQLLRIAVTPVRSAADLATDEQLAARRWWCHDESTGLRVPGPAHRREPADAAPDGSTGRSIPDGTERRWRPLRGATGPLQDLRVVEVTNNWAGPLAGRMLADLGADVIKVEWATRPATRALYWAGPFQDREPDGHERALYFHELNRNKRDVVIDLSTPLGADTFRRLIADVDVLIENNSARVMPNLGLDWPALQPVNPRLIMLSMSGYGADGPHRDWVAYGSNIETTSGLTSVTGYHDGVLSRTTLYYADPVSGQLGAVAVMAALRRRERTGRGEWIDLALNQAGAGFVAGALLEQAVSGVAPGPRGNDDLRFAPHGVHRCAGTDNWVAIACQSDADWSALTAVLGDDAGDLAADPALAGLAGRWANRRRIDDTLAAWTATRGQYDVARRLQAAGVSAAPVLANWQILADPHIHASGFYQPISHPEVGVYPTPTWPWRFAATPAALRRHAPLFAQDNRDVLEDVGLSAEEIEALYRAGVTADRPALP